MVIERCYVLQHFDMYAVFVIKINVDRINETVITSLVVSLYMVKSDYALK